EQLLVGGPEHGWRGPSGWDRAYSERFIDRSSARHPLAARGRWACNGGMEVRFRLPPLVASPVARLDARWRLVGVVLACVAVCLLQKPLWAGVGLVLAFALAWSAAMPWGWLLARLALLGGMLAVFALPLPFLSGLSWEEGFSQAGVIVGRGLALGVL